MENYLKQFILETIQLEAGNGGPIVDFDVEKATKEQLQAKEVVRDAKAKLQAMCDEIVDMIGPHNEYNLVLLKMVEIIVDQTRQETIQKIEDELDFNDNNDWWIPKNIFKDFLLSVKNAEK